MPITSITIENFKGIGDAVTIPIRPITLLFGKNSSGKSTVLQALRYMHEICERYDLEFEQNLQEFEQKLQEMRDREKSKDLKYEPKLQNMYELRDMLKAAHFLYLRDYLHDQFDYRKISKSVQTSISEDISNVSDAALSDFNSQRYEVLESIQKFRLEKALIELEENQIELEAGWGHGKIDPDHFTELGSFSSLVHRQELDRKIRIRLEFDITPEQLESLNGILSLAMKPEGMTNPKSAWIEMVTGWDKQRKPYLDSCKYALNDVEWICLTPENRRMSGEVEWNYEGRFIDLNIYSKNFGLSGWMKDLFWLLGTDNSEGKMFGLSESKLKKIRPWLEQWVFEYRAKDVLKNLHNIVLGELKDIRHLGPVRDVPRRNSDSSYGSEGPTGLWAWRDLKQDPQLLKKTNRYMKNLALGYSIRQSKDNEHEIQLYDETHKIPLHPLDVGFGVSQVIPVVVGVLDDTSQIFAVEQPELHLHPAAQVALGDVFIDGIKNGNRTMLIETHSEHLLLRLLRRVRETTRRSRYQTNDSEKTYHELTPNDLSVVYVRPTSAGVKFTPLTVTDKGDFDAPWPEGFFEERDSEWY